MTLNTSLAGYMCLKVERIDVGYNAEQWCVLAISDESSNATNFNVLPLVYVS